MSTSLTPMQQQYEATLAENVLLRTKLAEADVRISLAHKRIEELYEADRYTTEEWERDNRDNREANDQLRQQLSALRAAAGIVIERYENPPDNLCCCLRDEEVEALREAMGL